MASIFDFDPDAADKLKEETPEKETKVKRSKHREALSGPEMMAGKTKLASMVDRAFAALDEAILHADHGNAIKAATIILDRAGYGPKSTVDVNSTHVDLSSLSREELAVRATQLAAKLRGDIPPPSPVVSPESGTIQ